MGSKIARGPTNKAIKSTILFDTKDSETGKH